MSDTLAVPGWKMDELCLRGGKQLRLPPGVDGVALMQAFADNESNYGLRNTPRYEPAYDHSRSGSCPSCKAPVKSGGRYATEDQRRRLKQWGALAACSISPWQVMYAVMCELGVQASPTDALLDPEHGARAFVLLLNARIRQQVPQGSTPEAAVRTMGDAYNSGNSKDGNVPLEYMNKLWANYERRLSARAGA